MRKDTNPCDSKSHNSHADHTLQVLGCWPCLILNQWHNSSQSEADAAWGPPTRRTPPHLMPTMTLVYKFVFSSTSFKLWHLGAWVNTVPNTLLSLPLLPWGFCYFIKISVPPCAADTRLRIIKKFISTFLTLISRMFWLPLEMNTGFSKCLNTGLFT